MIGIKEFSRKFWAGYVLLILSFSIAFFVSAQFKTVVVEVDTSSEVDVRKENMQAAQQASIENNYTDLTQVSTLEEHNHDHEHSVPTEAQCPENLYFLSVNDDPNKSSCTHGPDEVPANTTPVLAPVFRGQWLDETASRDIECFGNGVSGKRVQALYVTGDRSPDFFDNHKGKIAQWAGYMDLKLNQAARREGSRRHIKWVHDGSCNLDIQKVVIPESELGSFQDSIDAVKAAGFDDGSRRYVMWVDAEFAYCGIAEFIPDDRKDPNINWSNTSSTPAYARADTHCWGLAHSVELHELLHVLGAVQYSSPNSNGFAHCIDEYDLMCYSELGAPALRYDCIQTTFDYYVDCGGNDYFDPTPEEGEFLDQNWNIADSDFLFDSYILDTEQPTITPHLVGGYVDGKPSIVWGAGQDNEYLLGYNIYRSELRQATTTLPAEVNIRSASSFEGVSQFLDFSHATSWIDATAKENSLYEYHITAVDDAGNESDPTNAVQIFVGDSNATKTDAPTNLRLDYASFDKYTFSWDPVSDTSNLREYYVEDFGGIVRSYVSKDQNSFTRLGGAGFPPGSTFQKFVRAVYNDGTIIDSEPITINIPGDVDTEPPEAPGNLTKQYGNERAVSLTFARSSDNHGVGSYKLYRDGVFYKYKNGLINKFVITDDNVAAGRTYTYYVTAEDDAGNESEPSNTVSVYIAPDSTLESGYPNVISNLSFSVVQPYFNWALIEWDASSDDSGFVEYFVEIRSVGSSISSYRIASDTELWWQINPGQSADIWVSAVDPEGNTSNPQYLRVTMPNINASASVSGVAPQPKNLTHEPTSTSQITLLWSEEGAEQTDYYEIYRDGLLIARTSYASFGDATVNSQTSYVYHIIAVDSENNRSLPSQLLRATSGVGNENY